jgi:hypothetical protein
MTERPIARWPDGKRFAFTIVDDTDDATLEKIRPVYALLDRLGMRTTKTVWVLPASEDPKWRSVPTLEDPAYRDFIVDLQRKGFEIALHGVRGTTSTRDTIVRGLDRYAEVLGRAPRIHVNHSKNADNLYWGEARLPRWRRALRLHGKGPAASLGHDPGSPYFWGDLCRTQVDYVRGLTFDAVDTLACDPYMPYHDRRYPLVNAWFSCSNGAEIGEFRRLLSAANIAALRESGGACIVYTHFGTPGFVDETGEVARDVREILVAVARENAWFRPASEILDHLRGTALRRLSGLQRFRLETRARLDRLRGAGAHAPGDAAAVVTEHGP